MPCGIWDLSSLTKDQTHTPFIGSVKSLPLVHRVSPPLPFQFARFLPPLIGVRTPEAEREPCLAAVVSSAPHCFCSQARCPRIPVAADVTVLVLRQVHVWVTQGPEGPTVRAPLQRDLLWLRLFWSPSLLLWEEKMFAAGVRPLGSHSNKLVQARLIPVVFPSVSTSSVFSLDPPLCPVFSLSSCLPSSHFPCSQKPNRQAGKFTT